jgi:hypothetical protein
MTEYILSPVENPVFNPLDSLGLLLGTPRLEHETNIIYKQRLLDVFVHRSNSSYLGLIYGITREFGLSLYEAITIVPVMNGDVPLGNNPAVLFEETKCYIYSDITNEDSGLISTLDRFDANGGYFTLNELITGINNSGYFTATLRSGVDGTRRSMQIYNQGTTTLVSSESISGSGAIITLDNTKLISNTISLSSNVLTERVYSSVLLTKTNQYYIDTVNGIIYCGTIPERGALIRYKYRNDNYIVMASPIIIHNLQSIDFQTKMFEQVLQQDNSTADGMTTILGAELVNELLSVFPLVMGK